MYDWLNKTKSKFNANQFLKIYINFERQELINRINLRTKKMLTNGAIQEAKKFNNKKIKKDSSVNKVIGIKELKKYLKNEITLDQASELIAIRTRQYVKRQATWARSRRVNWNKIHPNEISSWIKKINKLSLKLDQLI